MGNFIARRLLTIAVSLFLATLLVFFFLRLLPGDAVLGMLADTPHSLEMRAALKNELGLDRPAVVQYGTWLKKMFDGSFGGRSLSTGEEIASMVAEQLPVTLLLGGYTLVFSLLWALPVGVWSGFREGSAGDRIVGALSLAGLALPNILAASLVLIGLLKVFKWSPPIIYSAPLEDLPGHIQMMLWPGLILSIEYGLNLMRVIRRGIAETLKKPFILGARARGIPPRSILLRHVFPEITVTALAVTGTQFGVLIGGAVVLEAIFGLPGIGRGLVQAAQARDYAVIQSYSSLLVAFYLVINGGVDFLHGLIDPRIGENRQGRI